MKNRRQEKILEIIEEYPVETQEELIERLSESGFHCTQSTVSRDMKQLHLIKELSSDKKTYRYAVSRKSTEYDSADRLQKILHECCVRCESAQNLLVLRTMPGLGSAAGAALDAMEPPEMIGSVCGDDTALVILRTEDAARDLCQRITAICK